MTCGDLVKLIQSEHLEDAEIFYIECESEDTRGYLSLARNYTTLPYPKFHDAFTGEVAKRYDSIVLTFDQRNGSKIDRSEKHVDNSSEEYYSY